MLSFRECLHNCSGMNFLELFLFFKKTQSVKKITGYEKWKFVKANNQSLPSFGDHELVQKFHNDTDSENSEKPRHDGNHPFNSSEIDEFFYHTDVRIDFKRNLWYWNSTNEVVDRNSWDNTDSFQSYYPYMQDAVALNIYTDKVLYRIFVSGDAFLKDFDVFELH